MSSNYVHVHQKCVKCGGCIYECEHRVKTTLATTSSQPFVSSTTNNEAELDSILAKMRQWAVLPYVSVSASPSELLTKAEAKSALQTLITKSVVAELKRKMTLHVELLSSKDFKAGFSEALDQIDAANFKRIAELEQSLNESEKTK